MAFVVYAAVVVVVFVEGYGTVGKQHVLMTDYVQVAK